MNAVPKLIPRSGVRAPGLRRAQAWAVLPLVSLLLPSLLLLLPPAALAAKPAAAVPDPASATPAYQRECSACHLAYPPELLSARSWKQLMANLPLHFGADASLDPAVRAAIESWLVTRAGRAGDEPADGRISHTGWFRREHSELSASVWKRPAVRSASNCSACHAGAEQGDFDEDRVRIPR